MAKQTTRVAPVSPQFHQRSGFTRRAVLVGVILIPLNVYWVVQMERARQTAWPTAFSLFFNAIFTLLLLQILNLALRRLKPAMAFAQAELLLIYSMVCVGSAIAGIDFVQSLMPLFTYSFRMASPENKWDEILNPHMPKWLTVQDPTVIRGFYEGGVSFYQPYIVAAWLGPVAMWCVFILALVLVMVCINVLLRRRWLTGEHLACPLVSLPVQISAPRARLFGQKLFWLGFGLVAALEVWNNFAFLYPNLPEIRLAPTDLVESLRGRPWSAIGWTPVTFYPFLIGIGYLMPTDFLFSCWFFYLFWKAQFVLSDAFGLYGADQTSNFPYASFQAVGAYLLFAIYAVWLARGYLAQLYQAIIGAPTKLRDDQEPLSYRLAALGIIVGLAGLVWFGVAMGMRFWVSGTVFLIYYILALAITRMRAQFGTPVHDLHHIGPEVILTSMFGSQSFPKKDLVGLGIHYWFNRAYRSHPMPHQMEAMKMQDHVAGTSKGVVPAVMLAALVGAVASFWSLLHIYYDLGAAAEAGRFNVDTFAKLQSWLTVPQRPQWTTVPAIGAGLVFAFFLQTMRMRYVSWPFHPLGYAVSGSWQMNLVWMPLLIAWVLKTTITKYGGHKEYQRFMPVSLGFILADFVVISILNIVSIALRIPCYRFVD